ncbi:N-acetylglucosaminidase [Clostridium prolinivorans]|uniref:N-acetylglucosaminidase n=1 Tax=Clostridium prolinivorans TaxID=2769420 RepID=UPI0013E35873|nr:N-acetylglucosaminidase [Clostridium prolinivorans]
MLRYRKNIIVLVITSLILSKTSSIQAGTMTADKYYNTAISYSSTNPYEALNIYKEAYSIYSDDYRFINGINNSAITILRWSIGSHNKGNFGVAINGYDTVINSPANFYIKQAATRNKQLAINKKVPITSNEYYSIMSKFSLSAPYDIFNISNEAIMIYYNDKRFIDGINDSAKVILSWSKGSHKKGNFTPAINGYQTILDSINVNDEIISETNKYLNLASNKKIWYTADEYYNKMKKVISSNPYEALDINIEAQNLYPNDKRFIDGINDSAKVILSWSKGSHKKGNFTPAINGYQTIFNAPNVEPSLKNETAVLLIIAKAKQPYNDEGIYITNTNYTITFEEALDKQMKYGSPLTDLYGRGSNGEYWQKAKREDVAYYLNPNNFLEKKNIYQFLQLSGQAGINESELNNILLNKGILQGKAKYFIEASLKHNVNEIYLIAHSLLETGNGTSSLANGVYYGGKKVYNMYGVGAYDKPFYSSDGDRPNPVAWGAKYAYEHNWFTPEDAIIGGAEFIGKGYINAGQDTLYKMKWNPANPGNHQYATDIGWAVKQINSIKNLYDKCKNYILRFDIPVYKK